MLYDNKESVFWPRVPYARQVQKYLDSVEKERKAFRQDLEDGLKAKFAAKLLKLFRWFQEDRQSK